MPQAINAKVLDAPHPETVLTKAVLRASERLGLTSKILSGILGVSEATVSRMKRGNHFLERGSKPFELAVLAVRMFRSLDAITGGDEATARAWMSKDNTALGDQPANMVQTIAGLTDVIAYLDARRARI